ncbi:hypothetical protein CPU12_06055 [Malaciobacter molluscorum LMG 25693]|uniref:Uncharacterized protein n=1 Tax=Malaciobacter molluscorum LMG 25693 TaxID=870501 RepID=A0A2G1DIL3_9BACT|nr:hypothetical protein [Malaciobacter molluscorum]AXX91871.1 hypothetical protein AMOL_0877 [Malaciobacter molluscorum LMG 25693]PHO18280.1 hypothetical protein CPU12_06055 [Malaciobacter molluscorum LMG 25693]RXJ94163.1 hypothetical protein CRV00_08000 [Malaciobacter molluscorum]
MIDKKQIQEEIIQQYSNHDDFDEILRDFSYDINLSKWAYLFATKKFETNHDLSRKVFHYALASSKDFRDYLDFAYYISKEDGLCDNTLAKEAYKLAITKATLLRDMRYIADTLSTKDNSFTDENMAKSVYKDAIKQSNTAYDYVSIAESLCDEKMLNDKEFAKEVYELAIKACENSDELEAIAQSVVQEDNLADETWALKIYSMSSLSK